MQKSVQRGERKVKAVLISIKPKWCDLIRRGRKTVEVRKTCPKLEVPFKVYILYEAPQSWCYVEERECSE